MSAKRKVDLPSKDASGDRVLAPGSLNPRRMRRIVAEDASWNEEGIPSLVDMCVWKIVSDFREKPRTNLPPAFQKRVFDELPTDLPLEMTVKLIEDEDYWKRAAKIFSRTKDINKHGQSWKRLYFEKYVAALIESFVPGTTSDAPLLRAISLAKQYIHSLTITQLQPPSILLRDNVLPTHSLPMDAHVPGDPSLALISLLEDVKLAKTTGEGEETGEQEEDKDGDDEEEDPACDHIDLSAILENLPNIETLSVRYKMDNCGMRFNWSLFGMTPADAQLLGDCVKYSPNLSTLDVQESRMNDKCLRSFSSKLIGNSALTTINFSHNEIGDKGIRGLAKALNGQCIVSTLILCDNKIGYTGAQALGHALKSNTHLTTLDLRLNNIGDRGAHVLLKELVGNTTLKRLNLSSNGLTEKSASALSEYLEQNNCLTYLDITCNELGDPTGKKILDAIDHNTTLVSMDMRLAGFSQDTEIAINEILTSNLHRHANK